MKTIVNLVSAQTLPNYLFVKEMCGKGDKIIWIVTKKVEAQMKYLKNVLPDMKHHEMVLDKEENVKYIENRLKEDIPTGCTYLVNITGSTKLISLSVYNFFKNNYSLQSTFYYISIDKENTIINIDTQEEIPIQYRVSVDEYLALYGLRRKGEGKEYLSFENARYMYNLRDKGVYTIIDEKGKENDTDEYRKLREGCYKGKKTYRSDLKSTPIDDLEDATIKNFLLENRFPTKNEGKIDKYDVKYITGGWLEDLIYYITQLNEKPNDIFVGFHIYKIEDEQSDQELDVVYTKDNNLYIRECKTNFNDGKMFNDIVYKSAAIKTMFNSLGMRSSIYCCREKLDNDEKTVKKMKETLKKMGVTYFGKKEIDDELDKLN